MQNSHVLLTFSDVHIQFPVLAFLCVSDQGECFDLLTLYVIVKVFMIMRCFPYIHMKKILSQFSCLGGPSITITCLSRLNWLSGGYLTEYLCESDP